MSSSVGKGKSILKIITFLVFTAFLFFLTLSEPTLSLLDAKALQDIYIWKKSPSLLIPIKNLYSLGYYLLFAVYSLFSVSIANFFSICNFLFCGVSFSLYLLFFRTKLKNIASVLVLGLLYMAGYFLLPGHIFWLFVLNVLLLFHFPCLTFLFLPLLLFSSFSLSVLFFFAGGVYLFFIQKERIDYRKLLVIFSFLAVFSIIVFIDAFFYNFAAFFAVDKKVLLWQFLLFSLLFAAPWALAVLEQKFNFKKAGFFLVIILAIFGVLIIFRPFVPLKAEKDAIAGVKALLLENDLSSDDLILLDNSPQCIAFFVFGLIDINNFMFVDKAFLSRELFKKYLKHSVVGYVIAKDTGQLPFAGNFFEPEGDWDIKTDNLVYENMYGDTIYNVWKFNQQLSGDLSEGVGIFDDYKYLPQNLVLGAERMFKKINENAFDYMALTALGRIYSEMLDFPKAKKWLFQAMSVKDDYSDVYLHLAFTYTLEYSLSKNKPYYLYFLSKQLYLRGLGFEETNHEYYHLLGDLEEARGNLKAAVSYSQKALELSNNTCDPSHYRIALWELNKGNKESAQAHLGKAIANAATHSGDTPAKYLTLLEKIN